MAQYNHLPIFQLAYRLALEIYQTTHNFPREYKYTLGQKLKEISSDFLDFIVLANSQENKIPSLKEARLRLERLRIHIRLTCDLKIISFRKYEFLSRSLEELSKQLSGWQDWAKKSSNLPKSSDLPLEIGTLNQTKLYFKNGLSAETLASQNL